jgi:hypothetical protein
MSSRVSCGIASAGLAGGGRWSAGGFPTRHANLWIFLLTAAGLFYRFFMETSRYDIISCFLPTAFLFLVFLALMLVLTLLKLMRASVSEKIQKVVRQIIWVVEGGFLGSELFILYVVYANFAYVSSEVLYSPYFVSVDKGSFLVLLFTTTTLLPLVITGVFIGYVRRYVKDLPKLITTLLLLILAISYIEVVLLGAWLYPVKVREMRNLHGYSAQCTLEKAWSIANTTLANFKNTYTVNVPKPRQLMIPGDDRYLWVPRALVAVANTGSCEDFALELTTLLRDVLGCEARVVAFVGYDHALPEVKVDGTWYVLDIGYTTRAGPVKAEDYWKHLERNYPRVAAEARGLVDRETGRDVSAEHGFALRG